MKKTQKQEIIYCPKYQKDILKHLMYEKSVPSAIHIIEEMFSGIKQSLSRASDEIEKLRIENRSLKKQLRANKN